jgi:acyl-CoA synthetase (NDP forming)
MFTAEAVADAIIPVIHASAKPVVVALLGSELTARALARFTEARVPTYPFPERAVSALGILARRAKWLATIAAARPGPRPFPPAGPSGGTIYELLGVYGIQAVPLVLAQTAAEAAATASHQGFPIVIKIASPDIVHKSDLNGVILDIENADQAVSAYTKLVDGVRRTLPAALIEGVWVQRQVLGGQEVIVGVVRDRNFGPLVMFGSGGVEAEALGDVAFALAPLDQSEADDLIRRTWAGRRLDGFRNLPPADKSAVRDALIGLSWLAYDHPEFTEIEINPLRVLTKGAFALDVRVSRQPGVP